MSNIKLARQRAIETLARDMYEANDPRDTLWVRRGWATREIWLTAAKRRLESSEPSVGRVLWSRITSLLKPSSTRRRDAVALSAAASRGSIPAEQKPRDLA
jgi:hypothetical protein